jgi:zinc protease
VLEPEQAGERRVALSGPDPTAHVALAWPAPAATDADYFPFQVLDSLVGGAKSPNVFGGDPPNRASRLYRALVAPGLAVGVSSGLAATCEPFLYTVSADVADGVDPARVEAALVAAVAQLAAEPPTAAELERAVRQARAQAARRLAAERRTVGTYRPAAG